MQEKPQDSYYQDEKPSKEKKPHEIQKVAWKEIGRFDDYQDALKFKMAEDRVDAVTKIRRRNVFVKSGPCKDAFSVMQGTPLKKSK